jgi:hypothetical protein
MTLLAAVMSGVTGLFLRDRVQEEPVGALFFFLSLILFLVALWMRFRTPIKKAQSERELRSSYDTFFAGERTFEFDREKWTLRTQFGHTETLWTGLHRAIESPHAFALCVDNQTVMVPKRALTEDEVELLRNIALKTGGKATPFHVSLWDYLSTEIPSFWRRHRPSPATYLGLLTLLFLLARAIAGNGLGTILVWVLLALCVSGVILFLQLLHFVWKYMDDRKRAVVSWEGEFSDRGTRAKTAHGDVFLAWAQFEKFRETRRCFLLYFESERYHLLAKKCLTGDQEAALRQLLEAKLSKA